MHSSLATTIAVATLAIILGGLSACATAPQESSGFLKDYSQLKTEKDPLGFERRIWTSPKLTRANYQKVLVERVIFYPAPQPSERVSTARCRLRRPRQGDHDRRSNYRAGPGLIRLQSGHGRSDHALRVALGDRRGRGPAAAVDRSGLT